MRHSALTGLMPHEAIEGAYGDFQGRMPWRPLQQLMPYQALTGKYGFVKLLFTFVKA